uniref:Family with sequence similarity 83 member G n=1 Tax=Gopherus evgoodei TaxID=1825980 RepID=A0A8C4WLY3_9SAUR
MALSQVQCLDDSHVNWRSSESKPEFFYSEEQRLALEALVSEGPEAFYEVLKKENIRDFLSELELKKIMESLETYDPGSEYIPPHRGGDSDGDCTSQGGEGELAPSLEYWPQRSDRSIPQLDLGWPETIAYRGVTRAMVYMQPPIDGQAHIKEVVRKMIVQAQKVVAVVMDMFTDVDIFKDLLDAGFKRKVGVYIIVDETNAKYFLQMCDTTNNLRVRTTGGTEFFTHSATKFKGALAQKFMFVDGDRAMCGSYSFTWSAARTDRNLISVLSGQVVEAFDKQFQELYLMSRGLSLKSIPMDEEPEPEPFTLPSVMPVTPANAVVKRLINPKYALVKAKSADQISKMSSERQADAGRNKIMDSKDKALPEGQAAERQNDMADLAPPIHPGLLNMEKPPTHAPCCLPWVSAASSGPPLMPPAASPGSLLPPLAPYSCPRCLPRPPLNLPSPLTPVASPGPLLPPLPPHPSQPPAASLGSSPSPLGPAVSPGSPHHRP